MNFMYAGLALAIMSPAFALMAPLRLNLNRGNFKLIDVKRFYCLFNEFGNLKRDTLISLPCFIYQLLSYILFPVLVPSFIVIIILDLSYVGNILGIVTFVLVVGGGASFMSISSIVNHIRKKKKEKLPKNDFMESDNEL